MLPHAALKFLSFGFQGLWCGDKPYYVEHRSALTYTEE